MESLKLFRNDLFGDILVIVKNNKEYFDANSIANVLGYSNPRDAIIRHCKEEGIIIHEVGVTSKTRNGASLKTQMYKKKFIDEGNLYRLIMKSKLKSACKFERWVCDEVIPSIRKHGAYIEKNLIDEMLENPDLIISLAQRLKNERLKVNALNKVIIENEEYMNLGKIIEDTPKQIYIESGLFKLHEKVVKTENGEILSTKPLITGKGQKYFIGKILESGYLH